MRYYVCNNHNVPLSENECTDLEAAAVFVRINCLVTNYGFLLGFDHADWFGYGFINRLASDSLLCPFHKKMIICEKMSLVFCKTDKPRFSFIMYCY